MVRTDARRCLKQNQKCCRKIYVSILHQFMWDNICYASTCFVIKVYNAPLLLPIFIPVFKMKMLEMKPVFCRWIILFTHARTLMYVSSLMLRWYFVLFCSMNSMKLYLSKLFCSVIKLYVFKIEDLCLNKAWSYPGFYSLWREQRILRSGKTQSRVT